MSRSRVFLLAPFAVAFAAALLGGGCGAKPDPLKADLERFCARTDVATKPPSEWGPAAVAEAKTAELRGALEPLKSDGSLAVVRSRVEELAGKAGLPGCAAVAGWPRQ